MCFGRIIFELTLQDEYDEVGEFMVKGQADGWLQPVIGNEYPLDHAADAHIEVLAHKSTTSGKIVLNV